jgi:hypothetical protein
LVLLAAPLDAQRAAAASVAAVPAARSSAVDLTTQRTLRAHRMTSGVTLDGRLDEATWLAAPVTADFVQQRPDPERAPTQHSEARVLIDGEAIYVGMRMFDTAPDSIVSPLARRDFDGPSDWAHVLIDSYYDRRTAFRFAVNPSGTKRDAMVSGDTEWNEDASWDAVWEVATARDSLGWTAEFRIPLSQLRFKACGAEEAGAERCAWGLELVRDLGRRNERSLWAPIPAGSNGFVSRFGTLAGLGGVAAARRPEIAPYSLGRLTRAPLEVDNPFYRRTDIGGSFGADIKYGVTSNLTLTATVNPDFGQVEADPSVVNLTAFETFFPERRPFFIEGSNIFNFPVSDGGFFGQEQLFYSRRIGRAPQLGAPDDADAVDRPDAATILGAGKVSGRVGRWTLGLMEAVTGAEHARYVDENGVRGSMLAEPSTSYTVARVTRDGHEGRRSVGGVFTATSRRLDGAAADTLRAEAYTGGVDWRAQTKSRSVTVRGNLLGSFVRGSPFAIARTQRSAAHLFQRPDDDVTLDTTRASLGGLSAEVRATKNDGHWRWGIGGRAVTPGFEINDVGFQQQSNVANTDGWLGYEEFRPGRVFRSWSAWTNQWAQWSLNGDRVLTFSNLWIGTQLTNFWRVEGEVRRRYAGLTTTDLRGGPALYTPSRWATWFHVESDARRAVFGEMFVNAYSEEGGGGMINVNPTFTFRPSSRAEVSLGPSLARTLNPWQYIAKRTVDDSTHYYVGRLHQTTSSLTARINYTFTPRLSLQYYAQPFMSAGRYTDLATVVSPRAVAFADRFRVLDGSEIARASDGSYDVATTQGGVRDVSIDNPDFNVRELRSTAVMRWEYRPGSTLFLVWSQGRSSEGEDGAFALTREARGMMRADPTNVLLLKVSYWLNP